jgi:CubicO group peptidase (beta-lactamase class C family)
MTPGKRHCYGRLSGLGWAEVENAFNDAVERGVIPGATVVVRRGGDVAFEGAFGYRSLVPDRSPMKIDTVFDLSSLTKALCTTTAVMMLARDGKLRLDDRVTRFFHNFGVHGKNAVTFRQLLAHCSGLAAWRPFYQRVAEIEKSGTKVNFMASSGAKEFVYEEIHREKPEAPPGTRRNGRKARLGAVQPFLPRQGFSSPRAARDRLRGYLDGALAAAGAGCRDVRAHRSMSLAQATAGRRS